MSFADVDCMAGIRDDLLSSCAIWEDQATRANASATEHSASGPKCTVAAYGGGGGLLPRVLAQVRMPRLPDGTPKTSLSINACTGRTSSCCSATQGFADGSVRLTTLAACAFGHCQAKELADRELTLACHTAPVTALLHHRWQPRVAAVPLEILVTGAWHAQHSRPHRATEGSADAIWSSQGSAQHGHSKCKRCSALRLVAF